MNLYIRLLTSPGDPTLSQIIRRHLNGYFVTGQDLDKVHSELAGNGCQNRMAIADIHFKHGIGQVVGYDSLNFDYVVFCQVVNLPGCRLHIWRGMPNLFVIRR